MAEYIDRDKIFPNGVFYMSADNPTASLDELIKRISDIPVADVVEVVRCKNCKHFIIERKWGIVDGIERELEADTWCDYHTDNACCEDGYCDGACYVKENDFCSYGEG